jgi:ATP-dependent Lhr-like helicase
MGEIKTTDNFVFIHSNHKKAYEVISILPDDMENFPWAGHIGTRLLHKVIPIIEKSQSTLIFTNTRSQCEIWYQRLLEVKPDLAGTIAMHHSAISDELRCWVEDALHDGRLKAVVCTSSLDLGVDFRPVESIVQIGGPKGVARFVQRAGRSGHQPGAVSRIYFVPTHALELLEGAALRFAIERELIEDRVPHIRSFDVLIQYLMTLAVSGGFDPKEIYTQIITTHAYASVSEEEWRWTLQFLISGSDSLNAYDEYQKLGYDNAGNVRVLSRALARKHRMSIGTIVGDHALLIRYLSGKRLGTVEESFISQLMPGDIFWFAGRSLEFVRIKENDVIVRKSNSTKGKVPSWQGGRMPLSSQMSEVLRLKLDQFDRGRYKDPELIALRPLLEMQQKYSKIPTKHTFLLEYFVSKEGYHLLMYPFEGRFVHEGLGALLAYRIARNHPRTFSIAMNDYGLELLSDEPIPIEEALENGLLDATNLTEDIQRSVNEIEMARRRFREISAISGLIFQGYPGKFKRERHLQSSAQLLFNVFHDYEPENLLYLQAYEEAKIFQFEESRLREALIRISNQKIAICHPEKPTPLAFPIMVDRLREKMSTERLADRVLKMQLSMK